MQALPQGSIGLARSRDSLSGVGCGLTSDVSASFPSSRRAPSLAREFVQQHCCPVHGTRASSALALVTSELVTNAVLHGAPPITVHLSCQVQLVRVVVSDGGSGLPDEQGTSGGLGLMIVAQIARAWGVRPGPDGKGHEIWCLVPTGVLPTNGGSSCRSRPGVSEPPPHPAGAPA